MADFLLRIRSGVRYSGPIFDFRARRAFADFKEELEEEAAEWALDHIRRTFHTSFKQPTGYYESTVRVRNTSTGHEVWDGGHAGAVYGPWLEGVGSRNSTTRFKGYHAFRKAASALERRIEDMGDRMFRLRYKKQAGVAMGYRKIPRIYTLEFDGDLKGLIIRAKSISCGALYRMLDLMEADGRTSEMLAGTIAQLEKALVSWNLVDDDGVDVPLFKESLEGLDINDIMAIANKWMAAMSGPGDELGKGSPSGGSFPGQPWTMEAL